MSNQRAGALLALRDAVFELVINLETAKTLGLTIPSSLLRQADQIIQ